MEDVADKMLKIIVAFLNFVIWGSGYFYQKEKNTLGILFLIGYVLVHVYWFTAGWNLIWTTFPSFASFLGHLSISCALVYDAYKY